MDNIKQPESQGSNWWLKIGSILLVILIIATVGSYLLLSDSITKLNDKIEIESDDHYIQVQNEVQKSVVLVISHPANLVGESANNVIYIDDNGEQWNQGTGFSIDKQGNILTANHVVGAAKFVTVILPNNNGQKIPVESWKQVPDLDLAILYVNSSVPPVKIHEGSLKDSSSNVGSSVAFIGFPAGLSAETTVKGSVSGIFPFTYKNERALVYILGGTANPGNSGGPVFSLKTGQVIGIINSKIKGTEGIIISTAINQDLINNIKDAKLA